MKAYQGADIMQLKKAVRVKMHTETTVIESSVRVSKANGQIQRAIRTWQFQCCTRRLQLEDLIECNVPNGTPVIC